MYTGMDEYVCADYLEKPSVVKEFSFGTKVVEPMTTVLLLQLHVYLPIALLFHRLRAASIAGE